MSSNVVSSWLILLSFAFFAQYSAANTTSSKEADATFKALYNAQWGSTQPCRETALYRVSVCSNVLRNEGLVLLHKALLQLPNDQRVVVIMKEYEGLTFPEIAEILDEPINTVKSRMYYGLRALKKTFDSWNINKEVFNYE